MHEQGGGGKGCVALSINMTNVGVVVGVGMSRVGLAVGVGMSKVGLNDIIDYI